MGSKTGLHLVGFTFDGHELHAEDLKFRASGPRLANPAGWRTGAEIKFPVY
jgi:hypothetical protein